MRSEQRLTSWLQEYDEQDQVPEHLHGTFMTLLNNAGFSVYRSSLWLPTRHPELWGTQLIWSHNEGVKAYRRDHGITQTSTYLNTPGERMHQARKPLRWQLAKGEGLEMSLLQEIADEGGNDYLIVPFHTDHKFEQPWITFATKQPDGFTNDEIDSLISYCMPLSWKARVAMADMATRSLLQVYLGANAADHVLQGEFQRGTGTRMDAVIWFCDMRGFTSLGDRCSSEELVAILDDYFEVMSAPIESGGGEILKFIGDAILAVFPLESEIKTVATKAIDAAQTALAKLSTWREQQTGYRKSISAGIALHMGSVLYGNIGGSSRLDFTVIGAAVNEASRIESLCKTLAPLLVTEPVALAAQQPMKSLGQFELRGVEESIALFTPQN